jgi:hypothetical protein
VAPNQTETVTRSLNIDLPDFDELAVHLRDGDTKHAILQLGSNALNVHLGRVGSASQPDLPLEGAHLPLVQSQCLQELFIARPVDNACDIKLRLFGVPVDANILFLGAREVDVDDIGVLSVEDISFRLEVIGLRCGFARYCYRRRGSR